MARGKPLRLGIPKGSLQDSTIKLFANSGWKIRLHHRNYFPDIDDPDVECTLCRAQEMPVYIEDGTLDVGLTGKDWILENEADVAKVCELVYSKTSNRPARWVLAVASDSPFRRPEDLQGKKIATELENYTRKYFQDADIPVEVEFSWGATEAKVASGLADAIVEVTETGTTIKAHGLRIIAELMQTSTQLIANKEAMQQEWKRSKIDQMSTLLQGALRAERLVGLKMNVPRDSLQKVMQMLPSLTSPTVADLYQEDWLSVEIVVEESIVRDLIPRLRSGGVEGIIEYPLNKVI
ncbi:MAG: ATP phosphoribosyltransferase [Desulfohalobiaceae bacterium]|nr:ATP phosphoribosyltransferase [Desulfohalobiaceae bacterium]